MKRVGIVGATGAVGLEGIEALLDHPWFDISNLYASERSAGKKYKDATKLDLSNLPEEITNKTVQNVDNIKADDSDIIFSALPSRKAREIEPKIAQHLPVMSTTSAFRYEDDVPILITEVNSQHAELLRIQQENRGWKGFIAPEPNCTTVGLVMSLKPICDALDIKKVIMTSYQAVSGAGYGALEKWKEQRTTGTELPRPFLSEEPLENQPIFEGNVIGYIKGEEQKVKRETLKILGEYKDESIIPANFEIECFCVRVPTYRGHLEAVFVEPARPCSKKDIESIYEEFNEKCKEMYGKLPSSPKQTIRILDRAPQPRYDVNLDNGMSAIIGRIEVTNDWIKYLVLSDNLRKGAAKGSIQVMEYLFSEGYIE